MNVKGHAPARHHAEEARAVLHLQVGKMEQEGYQAEGGDPEHSSNNILHLSLFSPDPEW